MHKIECTGCGVLFACAHKRQYCTPLCRRRISRARHKRGSFVGPLFISAASMTAERICQNCGTEFTSSTHNGKWCKDACRLESRRRDRGVAPREKAADYSNIATEYCVICHRPHTTHGNHGKRYCTHCKARWNQHLLPLIAAGKLETECVTCGVAFSRYPGSSAMCCGEECSRASDRIDKARRRRAARQGEKFDPFEIFARDQWRCQHCNCKTPKTNRGTFANSAPELDHIVPLSKGGGHTRANTQLLCRRCNQEKGSGSLHDQTRLFG